MRVPLLMQNFQSLVGRIGTKFYDRLYQNFRLLLTLGDRIRMELISCGEDYSDYLQIRWLHRDYSPGKVIPLLISTVFDQSLSVLMHNSLFHE